MNIFRCVFSNQTTSNYSVYIALQESRDFISKAGYSVYVNVDINACALKWH